MLRPIAIGCAFLLFASPVRASSSREHAHLRPTDASLRRLIDRGAARSATLRTLVDRLQQTDVVVFVEYDPLLPRDLAGGLRFVVRAGSLRLVRISLSRSLSAPQILRTLGHELQHALEVAGAPQVVDEASLNAFYRGIASRESSNDRLDTTAAQHAGDLVGADLRPGSGRPSIDDAPRFSNQRTRR